MPSAEDLLRRLREMQAVNAAAQQPVQPAEIVDAQMVILETELPKGAAEAPVHLGLASLSTSETTPADILGPAIETSDAAGAPPPASAAAGIAHMLHSPDRLREAILASEILRRPTERW
jgi:hypothetical protein